MPKMKSASGIHAMPEIGRSTSIVGSTIASSVRDRPIARPSGIAITAAMPTLSSMRPKLIAACRNSSRSAARSAKASPTASGEGSRTGFPVQRAINAQTTKNTAIVRRYTSAVGSRIGRAGVVIESACRAPARKMLALTC